MPKGNVTASRKQINEVKSFLDSQYVSEDAQYARLKELFSREFDHHAGHTSSQKAKFFITLFRFMLDYEITTMRQIGTFRNLMTEKLAEVQRAANTPDTLRTRVEPEIVDILLRYIQMVQEKYNL